MFETQRLANSFPRETKTREDPSSLGFRMLSIVGDISQQMRKDLIRFRNGYFPKTSYTDYPFNFREWDVSDFEFTYLDDFESREVRVPVIEGDSRELTQITTVEDFIFYPPTRIALESTIIVHDGEIYNSNINESSTIGEIEVPGRLFIEFRDVDAYSISQDASTIRSSVLNTRLTLVGEDNYGNELIEEVFPTANGTYRTKNIFAKLSDFTLTNIEGENGVLIIKTFDFDIGEYISDFASLVEVDIEVELLKEFDESFVYIRKYVFPVSDGKRINSDKDTFTGIQVIDPDTSEPVVIEDISFIPSTETLVVLGNNKLYFVKDWLPKIMSEPQEDRSLEVLMTSEALNHYPYLEQAIKVYLYQRIISDRVSSYQVRLIDPTGQIFYLNSDDIFTSSAWTFTGVNTEWPGDSTEDRFIEFALDVVGQWDLVIESTGMSGTIYKDVTSFYVPSVIADKAIELSKSYESVSFHENGKIYLFDGTNTDVYLPSYDYFFLDSRNGKIYTLEEYEELELNYV